jgi:hypothetical protein
VEEAAMSGRHNGASTWAICESKEVEEEIHGMDVNDVSAGQMGKNLGGDGVTR